ncbi:protein vav isoform X2 [Anthonomus grandis grandis]|uniref:protein vav isoform X2 n=1 Tax=Anthonomus grandis grandis TaxID=2921223 RepID=UPI0021668EA8|nr:protein vav isoform X2 [Anthonomus grandis grandis]
MALSLAFIPDPNDELWKECCKWLTRWEMIRPDHKAHWEGSTIADFAVVLRDGVLLCKLLNKMDPGCIDMKDVSLRPTMAQFLCLRNIGLFLKTCKATFGLSQADLFEDTMLFDLSNFHKVLCTLSKLSRTEKALRSGIQGFSAQNQRGSEEEVIYQSLTKIERTTPNRSSFDLAHPNFETASGVTSEEIYQDLLVVRSSVEEPIREKRDFVIKELLDTEKNYVDVLNKLKMSFMMPLQGLMKTEDHTTVFHKIKELYEVHSAFLVELTKMRLNPNIRLSQIFQQFKERFLIYGDYCANLTRATALLQELCDQDESFNQAVTKYEKDVNNGKFKLRDVLSVPVQRILKYHLLLEKLVENTEEFHEEHSELKRAWEDMKDVAAYINEANRDIEHLNVINNLQETIIEWDHDMDMRLSDYGKLIKDAELKIRGHNDIKNRNRYVFIFDKCILICKSKGNQFAYRDILNILEYHVEESSMVSNQPRWSHHFLLVKNGHQMVYNIYVRTMEMKEQIIAAIAKAHDNIRPQALSHTNHNFEMHKFEKPVTCLYCCKYLKGLIFQGYLCQKCQSAVHKECIQFSGKCGVPSLRLQPQIPNGINERDPLRNKLWYVGEMDRAVVQEKMERRENGTFLVRISTRRGQDPYVVTLKADGEMKHMRIMSKNDGCGDVKKYYLSEARFFNSIEEMIVHYENYSLKENFARLDQRLLYPFYQLKAVVLKNHDAQDRNQLTVKEGWVLSVIGKDGYREGWWKGRTEANNIGYFPVTIIKLDGEVVFDGSN